MEQTTKRMGRPPKVQVTSNGDFSVTVKGRWFGFRQGSDGHVRALGLPERDADFDLAKERVQAHIRTQASEGVE